MKLWIFGSISYWRPQWTTKRGILFLWQKLRRGFSDDEVWGLYHGIAKYSLPRLKRLREMKFGHPGCYTSEQWWGMIDKMIWSMNEIVKNEGWYPTPEPPLPWEENEIAQKKYYANLQEGLTLFGRNFQALWN